MYYSDRDHGSSSSLFQALRMRELQPFKGLICCSCWVFWVCFFFVSWMKIVFLMSIEVSYRGIIPPPPSFFPLSSFVCNSRGGVPESLACGFLDPCLVGAWCSEGTAFSKGTFIRRGVRRLGCSNVGSHWFFSSCSTTCHFLCQGLWPSFFCFSFSEAENMQKISCELWEEQRVHNLSWVCFLGFSANWCAEERRIESTRSCRWGRLCQYLQHWWYQCTNCNGLTFQNRLHSRIQQLGLCHWVFSLHTIALLDTVSLPH